MTVSVIIGGYRNNRRKTTDLPLVTDKLYQLRLRQKYLAMGWN